MVTHYLIMFTGGNQVKTKKLFVALIVICMLAISQSAFATDDSVVVTPSAIGIGDTVATAIPITPGSGWVTLFLSNSTDRDFYKWKNTTGSPKLMDISLQSPAGANYDLQFFITYPSGISSTFVDVPDWGVGASEFASSIYLPANCEIYFIVKARLFNSSSDFYQVALAARNIDW